MKIAFIGQKGIPSRQGGVEKHVEALATRLVKAGHNVTVYSRQHYTGSTATDYHGVNIINLPSINTKHLDAITHTFVASLHAVFKSHYDIVHYHGVGPSLLAWIPRIFNPKIKVIVTFHTIDRHQQKWGPISRAFLGIGEWTACHLPHEVIAVSQTLTKYCKYRFDINAVYIPNGIDGGNVPKPDLQTLKKFNLKPQGYIVAISRLVQHKGLHTLVAAYTQIKTDKKLVIVGDGSNTGEYVARLHQIAAGNPNIIFTGQQNGRALSTLFTEAYAFVQPSETEGLSVALLEAMAYGVPIITSDIEENTEATGDLALIFKNRNANDLARQLKFAINHPEVIKRNATLAKTHTLKTYVWDDVVEQLIEVYKKNLSPTPLTTQANPAQR